MVQDSSPAERAKAWGIGRRDALKLIAGYGMMIAYGSFSVAENKPSMLRRPIPRSGEELPVIGMGTYRTFDVGSGPGEREPLKEVMRGFVDMGGKLIDSSPMYGNAETVVGDIAVELGVQGALFLATKVWTHGREQGIRQMEQSMRRMRTQRMDLMQVHNLADWRTQLATLHEWKAQGRVRYIGITHYSVSAYDDLERLMREEELDFIQLNYSIATREAERRLLPLAQERRIAVLVNRPFEQGALFRQVRGKDLPSWAADFGCQSWGQFFLKYIVSHPAVTCVIPATSNPRHLADNMQAGYGRLPDAGERQRMAALLDTL